MRQKRPRPRRQRDAPRVDRVVALRRRPRVPTVDDDDAQIFRRVARSERARERGAGDAAADDEDVRDVRARARRDAALNRAHDSIRFDAARASDDANPRRARATTAMALARVRASGTRDPRAPSRRRDRATARRRATTRRRDGATATATATTKDAATATATARRPSARANGRATTARTRASTEDDGDVRASARGDGARAATTLGLPRDVYEPLRTLLASQFVLFLGVGALLPALPLYAQSIGLSSSANGVVISAPALAMLVLNLPLGRATDRYGRKPLMMGGMVVMALADVGTAMSRSVAALVPMRMLLGVGRAGCECGDRAYLADLCARVPEKRGIIVAGQSTVHAVGLVIGPLLGGRLMEAYGAPAAFYYVAAAAVGTAIGYSFLPETLTEETREAAELKATMDEEDGGMFEGLNPFMSSDEREELRERKSQRESSSWLTLLANREQRVLLLCASANSLGFVAKLTVIPLYASGHLDASPAEVGNLFSITALLGLATAPLSGLAADKFGKKVVVGAALAACATGLFFGAQSQTQSELIFFIGAWGIGTAAAGPAINALAQELAPKGGEGEALTLPKSAADFIFLIGPLVLGVLDDFIGTDNAGMILCSSAAAIAAASCFFLPAAVERVDR